MAYILTVPQIEDILERSNVDRFDRESILDSLHDLEELADFDCEECDDCDCDDLEDEVDGLKKKIDDLEWEAERLKRKAERAVIAPHYQPHTGSSPDAIASWIEELTANFTGALKRDADEVVRWIRARG